MTIDHRGRAAAFSVQLTRAHNELRRQIRSLQSNLGSSEPVSLATHCLAFCSALTSHHEGEDTGMFAELAKARPDLAGKIAKLIEDHEMIGTILQRVADVATSASRLHLPDGAPAPSDGPALAKLKGELDGLAAIMESHFRFEERTVGAALDEGITDTGWTGPVFRLE
ncbi:hemerythrin domain-containing protein [Virgisporangium ochraceum]|uniref:Hemerythrin-like domain-containing protein n=1 Tax=Virgisporangium ochraceum TaxID=65505 RepID=A0A8J3ZXT0_9ACTN|nr:hemerythrin domain-containing protein [Virgisporangium ochraceum]GIJ71148.1 hypothetical protein Voc01_060650 [Virgisporangium ochraceum]